MSANLPLGLSDSEWNAATEELAHALYTVWMHAGQPTTGLIADRIRGALHRVPGLAEAYPQMSVVA